MACWLFKSEPSTFSFEDLCASPGGVSGWDGVRNYQARNLLRDSIKVGDRVLFYHSSSEAPAVVGLARVVRGAYPDPTQFDPAHDHFDPKAKREAPTWFQVDLQAERPLARPVALAELKLTKGLDGLVLLQRGSRLSVQPVSKPHFDAIVALGKRRA
jgi:predicted RNA-binding protein with PUA-like domain